MNEYLAGLIAWLIFILVPISFAARADRRRLERQESESKEQEERVAEETLRSFKVKAIARAAHLALTRQRAAAFGPWLASIIEAQEPKAGEALTAVRWTIRELDGSRFNIESLYQAEQDLLEMGAR